MTSDAQLGRKKLKKLDPRAHIGYLVGYNSTNIFRIWVPQLQKVISTRDVTFDERTFFDGKRDQVPLLDSIKQLIQNVSISEIQQRNQEILDEETDLESLIGSDDEDEVRSTIYVENDNQGSVVQMVDAPVRLYKVCAEQEREDDDDDDINDEADVALLPRRRRHAWWVWNRFVRRVFAYLARID
ncbi:hypothetical protein HIM_10933 [Hirsutella minnesotensis 3608]|uniref:Retroviral polymerase SH3-like domain-containing protein n=1 Tax=Hirsutella minnesotensis 3608 TaxID=1043627 RepID=A0A0F7ZFT2_9HYPO|nr:hypothetical protein HIM_10933 [Hirsutella minnesotensis 3608]